MILSIVVRYWKTCQVPHHPRNFWTDETWEIRRSAQSSRNGPVPNCNLTHKMHLDLLNNSILVGIEDSNYTIAELKNEILPRFVQWWRQVRQVSRGAVVLEWFLKNKFNFFFNVTFLKWERFLRQNEALVVPSKNLVASLLGFCWERLASLGQKLEGKYSFGNFPTTKPWWFPAKTSSLRSLVFAGNASLRSARNL